MPSVRRLAFALLTTLAACAGPQVHDAAVDRCVEAKAEAHRALSSAVACREDSECVATLAEYLGCAGIRPRASPVPPGLKTALEDACTGTTSRLLFCGAAQVACVAGRCQPGNAPVQAGEPLPGPDLAAAAPPPEPPPAEAPCATPGKFSRGGPKDPRCLVRELKARWEALGGTPRGRYVLAFLLGRNGRPGFFSLAEPAPPMLDAVLASAALACTYEPSRDACGRPVATWWRLPLLFTDD